MTKLLTDKEKVELERLNDNPELLSGLEKIFLAGIYSNGTLEKGKTPDFKKNFAISLLFDPATGQEYGRNNEDLGKALRASCEALVMVSASFKEIASYKKVVEVLPPPKTTGQKSH